MAHVQKVKYALERPAINPYKDDNMTSLEKALLTKSNHWEYENEWRLIRYREGPGVEVFRPENLTGVIFGSNILPDTMAIIQGWIRQRSSPIRTYKARIGQHKFLVHIDLL